MKTTLLTAILAAACILGPATRLCGQCTNPDPTIWNVVNNTTSGLRAIPMVNYDPATGMLSVDTLGVDRVRNTAAAASIGGDDVGMISLLVQGPPGDVQLPFSSLDLFQLIPWSSAYFAGKMQIIGYVLLPSHQFLLPWVYPTIEYPSGLTAADFGTVEIAVNFTANAPGDVLHGRVCIVPEPENVALLWVAGASAFFAANHRTSHPLKRP